MTATPHDPAASASDDAPAPAGDAALLVHARALEGLRTTQAELAAELAQGRELRAGLARLDDALRTLGNGQARMQSELAATRRRLAWSQRLMAALLAVVVLGGAAWWWGGAGTGDASAAGAVARGGEALAAKGAGVGASGSEFDGVSAARELPGDAARGASASGDRMGATPASVSGADGELGAALAAAEARVDALERAASRAAEDHDAVVAKLTKERNQFVGEASRLRADLVRAEQRFASLTDHGYQVPASAPVTPPGVTRTSERDAPAALLALNAALETLGVGELRVLETGAADEPGVLRALLVNRLDTATGRQLVELWSEARLVEPDGGGLRLVLRGRDDDPEAEWAVDVDPAHPEVFTRTSLEVPARVSRLARARRALEILLVGQQLELLALDDVVDGELRGLRLRALGSASEEPGELHAARAEVLADGPTLVLREGEVTREGVTRPFWRGEWRRPLPGADHAAWAAALESLP